LLFPGKHLQPSIILAGDGDGYNINSQTYITAEKGVNFINLISSAMLLYTLEYLSMTGHFSQV
jgi:hypothetical protein